MMLDTKRATVFLGHDLIVANAMLQVVTSMGLIDVPKVLLSEYAEDMLRDKGMYVGDAFTTVHVETDCQLDADGKPVIRDGFVADGAVVVMGSDGGRVRALDKDSIDALRRFVDDAIGSDDALSHVLRSRGTRMWLLNEMTIHALGTKGITGEDVPSGRPLVLMDIDDCLNVFEYDTNWYAHAPIPQDDLYAIDRDDYVMFPDAVVGMHFFGRIVPREMRVRWSSELVRDITALAGETGATFVWVTSWHQYSKAFEMTLWPDGDSPFIGYLPWKLRGMSDDGRHGKHLGISELLGTEFRDDGTDGPDGGSPSPVDVPCVVVIDDKGESFGEDFFASAVPDGIPGLTIAPDGRYGITRPQWQSVREFLRGHPGS